MIALACFGKMHRIDERPTMANDTLFHPTRLESETPVGKTLALDEDAWRKTFAAAQRVIQYHRTHLEARMAILRAQQDADARTTGPVAATLVR